MADYSRIGTSVSTIQNVIDDILAFVQTTPTGPSWVEDATYTVSGNSGKMFLRTAGGTLAYVYFSTETVETQSVLQTWWVPSTSNGYGGGSGPSGHKTAPGAFLYLDTTKYDYTQTLFADSNRLIVVLKGVLKEGVVPDVTDEAVQYQVLYLGLYTPHCDASDDTYPLVIAGNAGSILLTMAAPPAEEGFFPECLVKTVGPNNLLLAIDSPAPGVWEPAMDADYEPVKNSRGSEAFAVRQGVRVRLAGAEESFSFIGLYLSTKDHGFDATVSISSADHRSFPALLRVPDVATSSQAVLLAPVGTGI